MKTRLLAIAIAAQLLGAWTQEEIAPLGWVYGRYVHCMVSECYISVDAAGANVRRGPNGPAFLALVNGTPLVVLGQQGQWLLVASACNLVPTRAWSDTHGVPLGMCAGGE